MIRNSFLIIGILSLFYGLVFLLIPNWFIDLTIAENTNIAWLRNIGAAIIGILFFGSLIIYTNPPKHLQILRLITFTSTLQTLTLIYSRFFNEFSAKNIIVIDLTIYLAIIISLYLAYLNIFKLNYFQ